MVATLPKHKAVCKAECQNAPDTGFLTGHTLYKKGYSEQVTKYDGYISVKDKVSVYKSTQLHRNFVKRSALGQFLVLVLLTVLCLILCVICLFIRYFIHKESVWIQLMQDDNTISECYVPCELLSLSFDEDFETFDTTRHDFNLYVDENGTRICSFTNLTHVVERATERQARLRVAEGLARPEYLSCGNVSKRHQAGANIAYYTELAASRYEQSGQHDDILHWNTDPESSFTGSEIIYDNNRVRINASQFYFVYASVTFNKSSLLQDSSGYSQSVFYVTVEITTVYKGVEHSVRSINIAETIKGCGDGVGTLYLGSQIFLDKENLLYVSVSEGKRVVQNSQGNKFGLYVV